jgi:hypothetical protein
VAGPPNRSIKYGFKPLSSDVIDAARIAREVRTIRDDELSETEFDRSAWLFSAFERLNAILLEPPSFASDFHS